MSNTSDNKRFIVNHYASMQVDQKTGEPTAPLPENMGKSEIALNLHQGAETLFVKNDNGEIVATPLGPRALADIRRQLDELSQIYSIYGMARANGDTSPDGTIFFGERTNFNQIANICHFGYFDQQGKLYKRCANGRVDKATDGTDLYIDGSDGDLLFYIDRAVYVCKFTDSIDGITQKDGATGTVELNVFAVGLAPFTIYGHNAKKFTPFAIDPMVPTRTQLTEENNGIGRDKHYVDYRKCTHSIYNPNAPSYRASYDIEQYSAAPNIFTKRWRESSNGYPSSYASSVESAWVAQCKNEVETTNAPYTGMYYEFYEFWMILMFLELKSVNHTQLNMFGTGTTNFDAADRFDYYGDLVANGNSGWLAVKRTVTTPAESVEPTVAYTRAAASLGNKQTVVGANSYMGMQLLADTDFQCFTECLEPQRILSDIAKAGLSGKIWSGEADDTVNQGNIFTHDAEGNMILCSFQSTEFQTGDHADIVPNQRYYQVRNIPGCAGMKDGVMTAVINEFVKMELREGSNETYDYIIYKLSYPVYRGMSVLNNFTNQLQGCFLRKWRPDWTAENNSAPIVSDFIYAKSVDDVPPIPSSDYFGDGIDRLALTVDPKQELALEKGLTGVGKSMNQNGWASKADYNASLFAFTNTGAGARTGECAYCWTGNNPNNSKYIYAIVSGSAAGTPNASSRFTNGCGYVAVAYSDWAPRFSLPHPIL